MKHIIVLILTALFAIGCTSDQEKFISSIEGDYQHDIIKIKGLNEVYDSVGNVIELRSDTSLLTDANIAIREKNDTIFVDIDLQSLAIPVEFCTIKGDTIKYFQSIDDFNPYTSVSESAVIARSVDGVYFTHRDYFTHDLGFPIFTEYEVR